MRTARTITIDAKGEEKVLHGKKVPYAEQLDAYRKVATDGLPKGVVEYEFQASDGAVKRVKKS